MFKFTGTKITKNLNSVNKVYFKKMPAHLRPPIVGMSISHPTVFLVALVAEVYSFPYLAGNRFGLLFNMETSFSFEHGKHFFQNFFNARVDVHRHIIEADIFAPDDQSGKRI